MPTTTLAKLPSTASDASAAELTPPVQPGAFALTFCSQCEAGWLRQWEAPAGESTLVVCKLDMEKVNPMLSKCDNYEARTPIKHR